MPRGPRRLPDMHHRPGALRRDLSRRDHRMVTVIGAAMASPFARRTQEPT